MSPVFAQKALPHCGKLVLVKRAGCLRTGTMYAHLEHYISSQETVP